ncbi:helix-turn-helix domain-containing protein [Hyphomonas sp. NPDC076900]|uniref:helix-turn-helix domain-containing protein n=1 Tax=unclassified Hyphomonas TaxID=2630699 RepID=UPI003D07E309
MVRLHEKTESEAVEALKRAAMKLFAERGVDGVTVREIAAAAGQRNHGAVGYHFGSKADLIRALIVDGARLINDRRHAALDALEASGEALTLEEVLGIIVYPSVDLTPEGEEECYNRFIVLFAMTHRALFMEALGGQWNSGFKRCLDHLRAFMGHLPRARQTERIVFLESYLGSVLAAREARLADTSRSHPTWSRPAVLQHLVATMAAIVRAP